LNGGTGNDSLIGGEGNDTLISGPGIDTLLGGLGNDTYIIENSTVFIAENPNEGIDTVYASVDYNLGADLENLVLTGSNAINGLGNSLNNLIIGNDNNNVLNGGVGNDTLQGGAGNDTYRIGWDIGDSVIADFGDDAQKVGHLIKQWTKYVNANLNTGHDVISDSSGSDTLDFSGRISGLNVNLNQTSVQFQSHSGQYANSIQWNSGSIENVSGSLGNDIITGNAADNVLSGGFGDDYLHGSSGNDTLLGGLGKDTLLGGLGNDLLSGGTGGDIYRFGKGDGMDIVYDNTAMNGSPDTLQLNSTISREEIAIFMDNGNLEIGYLGSATDKITIQNQNTTAGAIERIQLSNGNYMTDADINQVISQMSAYAANQGISLTSLNDVKNNQELMAMINAAWHA
jgi:Ca2+-binding RTX toxin-like protein